MTHIFVELVLIKVLGLIVSLQIFVLELTEEELGELVLPLLHVHPEHIQVLTATFLSLKSLFLLLLVLFIGLIEGAYVLCCCFDLVLWEALTLDVVKGLPAPRPLRLPTCTLVRRPSAFNVLPPFVSKLAFRVEKGSEHVVGREALNHAHELLDSSSDSLAIEHRHQIVD